jgi:hypothetical protein
MVWLMLFILSSRFAVCFHSYKISSVLPEQWVWLSTGGALPRSSQTRSVYQFIIEAHVFLDVSCISHKAQLNTLEWKRQTWFESGEPETVVGDFVVSIQHWIWCNFDALAFTMMRWHRLHRQRARALRCEKWRPRGISLIVAFSSFQFQALPVGDSFARRSFTVRSISVFLYFAAWF